MVDGQKSYQLSDCVYPVDGGYSEDVSIYVLHREKECSQFVKTIRRLKVAKMSEWILLKASQVKLGYIGVDIPVS